MKKVTLVKGDEAIDFLVRGIRHGRGAVEVTIDKKGCLVEDRDALVIEERLGAQVLVEEVKSNDIEKEAAAAIKAAEAEAKKAEKEAAAAIKAAEKATK